VEFLGKFASTVKLSWQLWLVSIGLAFFRYGSLMHVDESVILVELCHMSSGFMITLLLVRPFVTF
jgi:hypothetical protein